jgi:hypothetical protein
MTASRVYLTAAYRTARPPYLPMRGSSNYWHMRSRQSNVTVVNPRSTTKPDSPIMQTGPTAQADVATAVNATKAAGVDNAAQATF